MVRKGVFGVVLVVVILLACMGAHASEWRPMEFRPGEHYVYEFLVEQPDGTTMAGVLEVHVQDAGGGDILTVVEIVSRGGSWEAAAVNAADDLDGIIDDLFYAITADTPLELASVFIETLWWPWFETSLAGAVLHEQFAITRDPMFGFAATVVGRMDVAERSGYRVEVAYAADDVDVGRFDLVIDPALALPIRVLIREMAPNTYLPGARLTVSMINYREDALPQHDVTQDLHDLDGALPSPWETAAAENIIGDLLDHLENWGLEIHALVDKDYVMLGATDGVAIGLEDGFFEVYYFDLGRTPLEIQRRLVAAEDTGIFVVPDMQMELAVTVYGEIMVAALEVGGGWVHPSKDKVEQALSSFVPSL